MAVKVLDDYYLGLTAIITVVYQLFFFAIAFTFKFDKLTDFAGGTNFAVLAITTLILSSINSDPSARQIILSLLLALWALRLSGFLLFRILKTGKDDRFDDKRDKFFPFLGFWVFQMVWVFTVSLPVTFLNSPIVRRGVAASDGGEVEFGTAEDIAGLVLWVLGFVIESVSDVTKYRFRSVHKDSAEICDKGFWGWSRHPNYFGEIIIQFGIYIIATSVAKHGNLSGSAKAAILASVVGPLFLTLLLMFVSGLPLSERPGAKKRYEKNQGWEAYKRYTERTSILIPFPPALYARMPTFLKRTIFLEFYMYVFDPAKHSDMPPPGQRDERGSGEGLVNRT